MSMNLTLTRRGLMQGTVAAGVLAATSVQATAAGVLDGVPATDIPMIYVLVALEDELPESHAAVLNSRDDVTVVYTGVGKVNAAICATQIAARPDCSMIINYGTAGALSHEFVGKLSRVGMVRQRDMDARPIADLGITPFEASGHQGDLTLGHEGAVLSTGDQFVTSTPELTSDLVDMEGYAIAKAALNADKPIIILKYGSDFANENATIDWIQNRANGAKLFTDWLQDNT